jgi:predicted membrane protein
VKLPRLLRGILGTAVTWGLASLPISAAFLGVLALFGVGPPAGLLIPILVRSAIGGAINGAVFAVALAITGRRKTPETLSAGLLVACGAIGGAFFPALTMGVILTQTTAVIPAAAVLWSIGSGALIGAALAGVTLRAIRRAARLDDPSRDTPMLQPADPTWSATRRDEAVPLHHQ